LRDLHPVHHDLPANARGAQGRRLPVVLFEADVVRQRVDTESLERLQVDLLHVKWRGLEDHLVLVVLVEAHRVVAVTPIHGTP